MSDILGLIQQLAVIGQREGSDADTIAALCESVTRIECDLTDVVNELRSLLRRHQDRALFQDVTDA